MSSRDRILQRLRTALARKELAFPALNPAPPDAENYPAVTTFVGDQLALAERFGSELEKLSGSYQIAETVSAARLMCINQLTDWLEEEERNQKGLALQTGQNRHILCWSPEALALDGLVEALEVLDLALISPPELNTEESRDAVRHVRCGLTSVTAACATTGTMILASSTPGSSRSASLLPYRHLALIPFSRLYPTLERWLAEERQAGRLIPLMGSNANLTFISGPSKSADIEGNLTLGVHGPKIVHALLFNDFD